MASNNLKDIMRKVIFDRLSAIPKGTNAILITDNMSHRLLRESKCAHDELQAFGIREMSTLLTNRPPQPTWKAVYFLTPSMESVQVIIQDFSPQNRLYEGAFIYFTSALQDYLFDEMQGSGVLQFVQELIELEIDFTPLESRVFHVDYPEAIQDIYGASSKAEVDEALAIIAKKCRAVLATLNEDPHIRYHDPDGSGAGLSADLARRLHHEMVELKKFDQTFPHPTPYDFNGPSTVLIVDRAIDLISPLLHSLSYQCLVHDLFEVREEMIQGLKRLVVEVDTPKGTKLAMMDGIDPLFASIRHQFFIDGFDIVKQAIKDFQKMANLKNAGVDDLKNAVMNLPESSKKKKQLDALMSLNVELNKEVMVNRHLNEVCEFEQTLVVGEDNEGRIPNDPGALLEQLENLLSNDAIQHDDKIRLLLIYILTVDGLSARERELLAEKAGLEYEDLSPIDGLKVFGVTPGEPRDLRQPDSPFTRQARKLASNAIRGVGRPTGNTSWAFNLFGGGSATSEEKSKGDFLLEEYLPDTDYEPFDRFHPAIAYILQDHLKGRLTQGPGCPFPYVEDPARRNRAAGAQSAVRRKDDWRKRGPGVVVDLPATDASMGKFKWARSRPKADGGDDFRMNGPRTFVFVLGGLSYAEIRAVYLIAQVYQREVYIGSTGILPAFGFVGVLDYFGKSGGDPTMNHSVKQQWGEKQGQKPSGTPPISQPSPPNNNSRGMGGQPPPHASPVPSGGGGGGNFVPAGPSNFGPAGPSGGFGIANPSPGNFGPPQQSFGPVNVNSNNFGPIGVNAPPSPRPGGFGKASGQQPQNAAGGGKNDKSPAFGWLQL